MGETIVKYHEVIEIDECEYIILYTRFGDSGVGFMSHKGNCKNPIHGNYTGLGTVTVKNIDPNKYE